MITKNGSKTSPKQWAVEMIHQDLELTTDYYYERHAEEWDKMTEIEKEAVRLQINKLHDRIIDMLERARNGGGA